MTRNPNFTWDGKPVEHLQLPRAPVSKSAHKDRIKTRVQTLSCTECELRDGCRAPVAPTFPTTPTSSFAIVGEAPDAMEDRKGQVFVSKPGQVLRRFAREAGLNVDSGSWLNVNACRSNETPTVDQRAACRPNLTRALHAANTRYLLLCGSVAVSAWRTDVKVTKIRGQWFIWWDQREEGDVARGWWIMPTLHPAAVLRRGELRDQLRSDLTAFAAVVNGLTTPMPSYTCAECGGVQARWDADGVGWCEPCWMAMVKARDKGVRRGGRRVHKDQASFKF